MDDRKKRPDRGQEAPEHGVGHAAERVARRPEHALKERRRHRADERRAADVAKLEDERAGVARVEREHALEPHRDRRPLDEDVVHRDAPDHEADHRGLRGLDEHGRGLGEVRRGASELALNALRELDLVHAEPLCQAQAVVADDAAKRAGLDFRLEHAHHAEELARRHVERRASTEYAERARHQRDQERGPPSPLAELEADLSVDRLDGERHERAKNDADPHRLRESRHREE